MLKHQDIIEKFTTEQKLSLIADISSLGSDPFSDGSFCGISVTSLESLNRAAEETVYPSFSALVNSWDPQMLYDVAAALVMRAKAKKFNLLEMPETNVKITPYSVGLTEDPYLSGTMSAATALSGLDSGVRMMMPELSLSSTDALYSDEELSPRTLREFFQKPFSIALRDGAAVVKTSASNLGDKYGELNEAWQRETEKDTRVLCECKTSRDRIRLLADKEKLCYGGSYAELKAAYDKYTELYKAFEEGKISLADIEVARAAGDIITSEELDIAVDNIVDFADNCLELTGDEEEASSDLAFKTAEASIVLLKNKNLLPLYTQRVAIFGELADRTSHASVEPLTERASALEKQGFNYIGFARGYDVEKDRSDEYIEEAVKLARRAEVAVVVLGYDERGKKRLKTNRTAKLPANQLALVDALAQTNVKIVAVLCGDEYPDMQFDDVCHAVLFAPLNASRGAEALCDVLRGISNPSGKLTVTCYAGTDEHFDTLRAYKENGRNKVGPFYGYRHYDTSNLTVKYPFGHGLSYTQFAYSNLEILTSKISFQVQNVGRKAGWETVQVYVGMQDSAVLRPKKELKDFLITHLAPGETKRITLDIKDLDLTVWDETENEFVTESGRYQIYVGASVTDIRLTGSFTTGREKLGKKKEELSDYLQAYSNIRSGGYTLEEPLKYVEQDNKGFRNFFAFWTVLVLCADIIYGYFHMIGWTPKDVGLYVFMGILTAVPIILTVILNAKHLSNKKKQRERTMKEKMKKRADINVDDLADEIPYEQLFEEEFAVETIENEDEETVEDTEYTEDNSWVEVPFDKELPLTRVAEEFYTFAYERGVAVDRASIRRLFAGFAASRLLVLQAEEKELLSELLPILSEYFDSKFTLDSYADTDEGTADMLYRKNWRDEIELSKAARRIVGTNEESNRILVTALTELKAAEISNCLTPILRYVDQPLGKTEISIKIKDEKTESFPLSENMWFIIVLAEGEKPTDISKYILDMASVVELTLQKAEAQPKEKPQGEALVLESDVEVEDIEDIEEEPEDESLWGEKEVEKTPIKNLTYSQFQKLVKYACRDYQLEEVLYKRIDKLEQYVADCKDYRIENKQWQRMEKFISVYLAMEGTPEEALDCAIANQLIYGMLICVANSGKELEEKFTTTLENIFGEEHVSALLSAVRESGLNV